VYYSVNEDVPVNGGKPRAKAGVTLTTCQTMRLPKAT